MFRRGHMFRLIAYIGNNHGVSHTTGDWLVSRTRCPLNRRHGLHYRKVLAIAIPWEPKIVMLFCNTLRTRDRASRIRREPLRNTKGSLGEEQDINLARHVRD